MEKFFETYKINIETLSPIHIGCGEDYMFSDYVIDTERKKLYSNDIVSLLPYLDDEEISILERGSVFKIQKLLYDKLDVIKTLSPKVKVKLSNEICDKYLENLGHKFRSDNSKNNKSNTLFALQKTISNIISKSAYIPGSSIKGAIRTALLEFCRVNDHQIDQKDIFNYQETFEDPLVNLKLSDAIGKDVDKFICIAQRYSYLKQSKDGKTPEYLEVININQALTLSVQIYEIDRQTKSNNYFSIKQIREACNKFYLNQLEQEISYLSELNYLTQEDIDVFDDVIEEIEKSKNKFILRVGHHSGFEAVTMKNRQQLVCKKDRSRRYSLPETIALAGIEIDETICKLPFGWVLCEIC